MFKSLRLLAFIVPEKSLKKLTLANMERKKKEITNEQISQERALSLLFVMRFYVPGQHYLGHFEDVASDFVLYPTLR